MARLYRDYKWAMATASTQWLNRFGPNMFGYHETYTPDMLLDATPGALRGVEIAGRSRGGFASLRAALAQKQALLVRMADVAEAHVSLWCGSPRVSLLVQVKP